jgi:hypothetical protein
MPTTEVIDQQFFHFNNFLTININILLFYSTEFNEINGKL